MMIIWIISVFLYILTHVYLVFRLFSFFAFKNKLIIWWVIIFLILFFPLAARLNMKFENGITRVIYFASSVWLGMILISLSLLLCFEIVNLISKIFFKYNLVNIKSWIVILVLIIWICSYAIFNWHKIVIKNVDIHIPKLQENFKIAYMSDVHIDTINTIDYLQQIVDKINASDADIVIINWDLIDSTSFAWHEFKVLNNLNKDVYFTFGNHERYRNKDFIRNLLKDTKVQILENKKITFRWADIIWLQDINWTDTQDNKNILDDLLKSMNINRDIANILVLHEPIWAEVSARSGIDLQVAWHTHDWQVFPFNLLVRLAFKYVYWLYDVDGMKMYVSCGVGTWWPPMRLGSTDEIVVFNLYK